MCRHKKVRTTKGGKEGVDTKAPGGEFIHNREKAVPQKERQWRSLTLKDGTVLRQYYDRELKKWVTQSKLKKIKKG